jgi:lysophospholipase L1-like esterase
MIEILLRTFYPQYGGKPAQFHPVLGVSLIPDYDGVYISQGRESVTHIHTNSLGFRDSDIQIPKPEDVFRILVLGDSVTFGLGVKEEKVFPEILEEMLNRKSKVGGVRFEVVNAGIPGYGTAQEILQYQLYRQQLNPDMVILAFFVSNDLLDNLCIERILPDSAFHYAEPIKPCFGLRNGELIEVHAPQDPGDASRSKKLFPSPEVLHSWVFVSSRVKAVLTSSVEIVELMSNIGINFNAHYAPGTFSWYIEESETGWPLTEKLLDRLNEEVISDNGKLVVVVLPSRPQTTNHYQDLTRLLFSEFEETAEFLADVTRPQDLLVDWGEKAQVPVLDGLPSIVEANSTRSPYLQEGHFNARGHRVIAQLINDYLSQNRLMYHE